MKGRAWLLAAFQRTDWAGMAHTVVTPVSSHPTQPVAQVWQLRGRYPNRGFPRIFNDATVGSEAKKLYEEAQAMLRDFVVNKRVTLNAVMGLYPAAAVGDDIEVYADDSRAKVVARLAGLRQQAEKDGGEPFYCISDFVAPKGSGVPDYVGMFACSAGGRGGEASRSEVGLGCGCGIGPGHATRRRHGFEAM